MENTKNKCSAYWKFYSLNQSWQIWPLSTRLMILFSNSRIWNTLQLHSLSYLFATRTPFCKPPSEIVNSSIYISPYWSPHHPQKSHWQESGLEMENYLRIYCFHRSSLPLDGVTMNVSWRNRIGTYSHYLCSIALTSSSSLEAEYRIRSERN